MRKWGKDGLRGISLSGGYYVSKNHFFGLFRAHVFKDMSYTRQPDDLSAKIGESNMLRNFDTIYFFPTMSFDTF